MLIPLVTRKSWFSKKKTWQSPLRRVEEVSVRDGKWEIWATSSAEPCRQVSHTLGTAAAGPRSASSPRARTTCWSLLGGECHTSGYLEYVRMWPGFQNKLLVILTVFNVQLFFLFSFSPCGFLFLIQHLEELIKLGDDAKVERVSSN